MQQWWSPAVCFVSTTHIKDSSISPFQPSSTMLLVVFVVFSIAMQPMTFAYPMDARQSQSNSSQTAGAPLLMILPATVTATTCIACAQTYVFIRALGCAAISTTPGIVPFLRVTQWLTPRHSSGTVCITCAWGKGTAQSCVLRCRLTPPPVRMLK